MTDASPLIDAQQKFVDSVPSRTTGKESCRLEEAPGRTLFSDLQAPTDIPAYPRAIVEGFVVSTAETVKASEENPVSFTISGEVRPGDNQFPALTDGNAIRVATGSLVGSGELSVVRLWEAKIDGDSFTISRPFPPRFFIEDQGCELKGGAIALPAGSVLTPNEIGVIASMGISTVETARKPRVTIFASGNEVVPYDGPQAPGLIRDCNSPMLSAAVREAGGTPLTAGIMKDDFDTFVGAAKKALDNSDMLVISGGTAVNGRDFISDLLREIGELIIDGVPMRSGRPLIMGIANNKPVVCVAGHPPEALRGFRLFGVAAINKLLGQQTPLPEER